jgi:cell shape-determining protein MreD
VSDAIDSNTVGLLLIAIALVAFGIRVAARRRPDRRRWSQAATTVIVVMFVGLVAYLASFWFDPTFD